MKKEYSTTQPLELIHIDMCVPMRIKSLQGDKYFMMLIDDIFRMSWITFLKDKSVSLKNFKIFKVMVENEIVHIIRFKRFDRGSEFTFDEFE